MYKYNLKTQNEGFIDITHEVKNAVQKSNIKNGICIVYSPHTTAGITINENSDPDVVHDLLFALNTSFPDRKEYLHSEGNSAAHLKTLATGNSVQLIIEDGEIIIGIWQAVYFCEYDGPRDRRFYIQIIGE